MAGGASLADLEPLLAASAEEIAASIRPPMQGVLDLHRSAGHHCVLLSASPHTLVVRVADQLGFDHGIGTLIDDVDGILTGKIVPPMCYGAGKLDRLDAVVGWRGGPVNGSNGAAVDSFAYADSMSDLPLLEAVQAPFVVAPDRRLRKLASERNWPVLDT